MPFMSRPTPSPEESRQALQQILSESSSASADLPYLAPPQWTGAIQRLIDSALASLDQALSYIFGKRPPLSLNPQSLDAAMTLLFYLAIIVASVVVGTFVYRTLARNSNRKMRSGAEAASPPLSQKELDTLIEEALKSGDLPQATRLMWRGFVLKWDMTPNTTPHEFTTVYPERLPESYSHRLYMLMYSGSAARSDFDTCRTLLERGAGDAVA